MYRGRCRAIKGGGNSTRLCTKRIRNLLTMPTFGISHYIRAGSNEQEVATSSLINFMHLFSFPGPDQPYFIPLVFRSEQEINLAWPWGGGGQDVQSIPHPWICP